MVPVAHIAGVPVEETLGMLGPIAATVIGAATVTLRSRWRRLRNGERAPGASTRGRPR
jgi:hypothetical protein